MRQSWHSTYNGAGVHQAPGAIPQSSGPRESGLSIDEIVVLEAMMALNAGTGMVLGMAFGIAFGSAFGQIAFGMVFGMAIGLTVGAAIERRRSDAERPH